jgi:hypothetical protein
MSHIVIKSAPNRQKVKAKNDKYLLLFDNFLVSRKNVTDLIPRNKGHRL